MTLACNSITHNPLTQEVDLLAKVTLEVVLEVVWIEKWIMTRGDQFSVIIKKNKPNQTDLVQFFDLFLVVQLPNLQVFCLVLFLFFPQLKPNGLMLYCLFRFLAHCFPVQVQTQVQPLKPNVPFQQPNLHACLVYVLLP